MAWRVQSVITHCPPSPFSAVLYDDLYSFDPVSMIWTRLTAVNDNTRPSARDRHGFTSAGGKLYVHGGNKVYCG